MFAKRQEYYVGFSEENKLSWLVLFEVIVVKRFQQWCSKFSFLPWKAQMKGKGDGLI